MSCCAAVSTAHLNTFNTTLTRGGGLDGYVQLNRVYTRSSQSIKIDNNQGIFID